MRGLISLTEKLGFFWGGNWLHPEKELPKRIVIAHDESSFKSGEVQTKRWLYLLYSPFFNKGNYFP